MALVVAAVTF